MLLVVALYGYRLFLKVRAENRSHSRIPALIVGANDTGEQLAGQLIRDPALPYSPVGFLDDDLAKQGALIHGIKVLGTIQDLPHVARLKGARMVLIPHPTEPTNGEVREAVERCRQARLEYRVLPALDHLLNGKDLAPEVDRRRPRPHGTRGTARRARPRRPPRRSSRGARRSSSPEAPGTWARGSSASCSTATIRSACSTASSTEARGSPRSPATRAWRSSRATFAIWAAWPGRSRGWTGSSPSPPSWGTPPVTWTPRRPRPSTTSRCGCSPTPAGGRGCPASSSPRRAACTAPTRISC